MPPTLQAASPARSGAISQLPAVVQVVGPGGAMQGAHGGMVHWPSACLASSESSFSALTLLAFTGVAQPQVKFSAATVVH